MYAAGASTGGAATLAMTGMAVGSWLMVAVGITVAGLALVALVRRPGKHRP